MPGTPVLVSVLFASFSSSASADFTRSGVTSLFVGASSALAHVVSRQSTNKQRDVFMVPRILVNVEVEKRAAFSENLDSSPRILTPYYPAKQTSGAMLPFEFGTASSFVGYPPFSCYKGGLRKSIRPHSLGSVMKLLSIYLAAAMLPFVAGSAAQAFVINGHWNATATNPATGPTGTPITLTWSLVPNGTSIPGKGGSNLISYLDTLFPGGSGSNLQARPWFTYVKQSFDR